MLFAQAQGPGGGFGAPAGGAAGPPPEFFLIFIGVVAVLVAIGLAIQIMFMLTLSRALHRVHPNARMMEPIQVWFNLIPFFNLVWIFITINRVADSIVNEYRDRGLRGNEDGARSHGMTYAILLVLSAIPYIGGCFGLIGLVFWIMYWVQIARLSRTLADDKGGDGYYSDDDRGRSDPDRDDDDRRRRRRRDDRDDDRDDDRYNDGSRRDRY